LENRGGFVRSQALDQRSAHFRVFAPRHDPGDKFRDHVQIAGEESDDFNPSNVQQFRFLLYRKLGLAS
jgi:hypothetical protein